VSIAKRFENRGVHVLDLIQAGNNGLLEAINEVSRMDDVPFSVHATPYIAGAIRDALAANSQSS
jgi:RNA polymerase primary sigma factor